MQLTQRPDRQFNRLRSTQRAMTLGALLTLALLLAACGVTTSGGQPGGTTNGTATATAATTPGATPGGTPVPSVPPTDAVTLTTDQTSYTPSATINVTLVNHRATSIFAFDHQTSCTILILQRQAASGWQAVGGCSMGRMTQRIEIKAGATMKIAVSPLRRADSSVSLACRDLPRGPQLRPPASGYGGKYDGNLSDLHRQLRRAPVISSLATPPPGVYNPPVIAHGRAE